MANVYAVKSGNWSDTTVWNTGALPTSADDVYSNTFTVTIDVSAAVLTIRDSAATGITAGGSYVLAGGINFTCANTIGVTVSANTLINATFNSPLQSTINANITNNGSSTASANSLVFSGTGLVSIVGNVSQPVTATNGNQGYVIRNTGNGTVSITGTVTGGSGGGAGPFTIYNFGNGNINVTGNVTSLGGNTNGGTIYNASTGTISITGNITGNNSAAQYGGTIVNASTGNIVVTGAVSNTAGAVNTIVNSSTGNLTIIGTLTVGGSSPVIGSGGSSQNTFLAGPFIGSSQGVVANNAVRWRWIASVGSSYMTVPNSTATGYKNLYTSDSTLSQSGQPAITNVRSGTIYGPNSELTGTCAVPAAGSVALGVPVDATTGTAILTQQNVQDALSAASAVTLNQQTSTLTTSGSIGERLKLASTVATTAQQLSDALSNE